MYWFDSAYEAVARVMEMGGSVLWGVAVALFFLWMFIFERVWSFRFGWKQGSA